MANFSKSKRKLIESISHWGNEVGLISEDIATANNNEDLATWSNNIITFCEHIINDAQLLQEQMKEE